MAACTAYFEAHTTTQLFTAITVSGYVASAVRWNHFNSRWLAALQDEGLTAFDAGHFRDRIHEFTADNWSDERRRRLVHTLARLVDEYAFRAFSCSVHLDDYIAVNTVYGLAEHLSRPYGVCAGHVAGQAQHWLTRRYPGDTLSFVFEEGALECAEIRRVAAMNSSTTENTIRLSPRAWTDDAGRRHMLRPLEACSVLSPDISRLAGHFLTPSLYEHTRISLAGLTTLAQTLGVPRRARVASPAILGALAVPPA